MVSMAHLLAVQRAALSHRQRVDFLRLHHSAGWQTALIKASLSFQEMNRVVGPATVAAGDDLENSRKPFIAGKLWAKPVPACGWDRWCICGV